MTPRVKLTPKELAKLAQDQRDIDAIEDDLKRAQAAGVPNMDVLLDRCTYCKQRIAGLKLQFSPGTK